MPALPPIHQQAPTRSTYSTSHALVPFGQVHGAVARHSTTEQLEARVNTLEQAHKMLLEEIVNMQARSHAWITHHENEGQSRERELGGMKNALGTNSTTLSHMLYQISQTEKRLYQVQSQLNHLSDIVKRTKEDNHQEMDKRLDKQRLELEEKYSSLYSQLKHETRDMLSGLTSESRNGAKAITDVREGLLDLEDEMKTLVCICTKDCIVVMSYNNAL